VRQLSAKKVKHAAGVAHALLVKRGDITPRGELTATGKQKQKLGPAGRAKKRAVKASGGKHSVSDYKYSKRTNRATLRR